MHRWMLAVVGTVTLTLLATLGERAAAFAPAFPVMTSRPRRRHHHHCRHDRQSRRRTMVSRSSATRILLTMSAAKDVFSLNPATTALVLIEYQNEFTTPGGKLHEAVKECMERTKSKFFFYYICSMIVIVLFLDDSMAAWVRAGSGGGRKYTTSRVADCYDPFERNVKV